MKMFSVGLKTINIIIEMFTKGKVYRANNSTFFVCQSKSIDPLNKNKGSIQLFG